MPCLPDYTITLEPSRIAAPTVGLPTGPFEIESYEKVANGTYGAGIFYLCGYAGNLKPLLDQHLEVRDETGEICYCGYVAEVYRCCGEYVAWGWSNETLYNRIAVTWSEGGLTQITPYQEDQASIQTHGVRELVLPLPSSSLYTPLQYAQRLLKELSQPRPVLHNTYKCRCNITYLRTQGYYTTLAWQTYHNTCGLADTGATFAHAQRLGVGFISNKLAINGSTDGESQIGEIGAHLLAFQPGDLLIMSGWNNPQNNIITTVTDFIKDDYESVTSDGIGTSGNRIHDANNSLIEFHPDELIQVSGADTGDLDGHYWVRTENDGSILEVQHENFPSRGYNGIPITITHGVTINVPSNLAQENPGRGPSGRVTIMAWDQYLCQPICNECSERWTATHLQIAIRRHGNPTASISLRVKASCTSATTLAWAALHNSALGTTIGTAFAYHTVELSTPITLAPGQCVYIEAHVINALGTNDYYEFGGSLAQTSSLRVLTGPDGMAWRATNYTTAVRLLEYQSITQQLFNLVSQGNFVTSVALLEELTFAAPTYRSGYTSLLYAIEQLLIMGDPQGNRLQLLLDCHGQAMIRTEPTIASEAPTTLDCCSCPDKDLCNLTAGHWLAPPADMVDVPGVFIDSLVISYKSCRARFIDRDFSPTQFDQSLRYPGVI